jgi:hypothetical protein
MTNGRMAKLVALVSPPVKPLGVPSNCKVRYSPTEVSLSDDTGYRPFTQRASFNDVITSLEPLARSASFSPAHRVVSLCSEFSTPTPQTIRETCLRFVRQLYPADVRAAIPIAAGLLLDTEVNDFLAPRGHHSPTFEPIDTYSRHDALDLIECGFGRFRRLRESVFVIHVGEDNSFFEWVVVPCCDAFVEGAAVGSLAPNEKLLFVLKEYKMSSCPREAIKSFRRISSVFRLVSDSFSDIATTWCFHVPTNVSFKSNSALLQLAATIRDGSNHTVADIGRSHLFLGKQDAGDGAALPFQNQDQETEVAQIEAELLRLLQLADDSDDDSVNQSGSQWERRRRKVYEQKRLMQETKERRQEETVRRPIEEEQQRRRDEELRQKQIAGDKKRREEELRRAIADEDRRDEEEEQARTEREKELLTQEPREGDEKGQRIEEAPTKTTRERIMELREKRRSVSAEEDDLDDEDWPAAADQAQQHRFLMRLVWMARNAAANEETSVDKLTRLDGQIDENLGNVDEKRAKTERQCRALADQLRQKKQMLKIATRECRLVRRHYLKIHNNGVQAKSELVQRIAKKAGEKSAASGEDYALTIGYLNREIEKVKHDIRILQLRSETQLLDLSPGDNTPGADI